MEDDSRTDMLLKARVEMGKTLAGKGNMSGFIGEQIALHVLGTWESPRLRHEGRRDTH